MNGIVSINSSNYITFNKLNFINCKVNIGNLVYVVETKKLLIHNI